MAGQVRRDGWSIEFVVEGHGMDEIALKALDKLRKFTKARGEWFVDYSVTPWVMAGDGSIVQWQANVVARRASA